MDFRSISLPVSNAIFFIFGSDSKDTPEIKKGSSIWSTPTCIAVGCTPDVDGETRITIGASRQVGLEEIPAFDGELETPSRMVGVEVVPRKRVLEQPVPGSRTRVRIWVNHPIEPDNIVIGLN